MAGRWRHRRPLRVGCGNGPRPAPRQRGLLSGRQASLERLRLFWWLLSAACVSWMLGEAIWTMYDLSGWGSPPVPSLADAGYLGFIPLAITALLCHPGLQGSGVRKARILLDGLAIAAALLFLSWTAVLGPLWRSSDLSTLGDFVTLAYPFGDVVVAFFVILALRRMESDDRLGLWCLLGGLIAMTLADSAFAYVVEVKGYTTGHLLDAGWFAGFLGIATGTVRRPQRAAAQGGQRVSGFVVLTFIVLSAAISLYDLRLLILMLGR